MNFKDLSKQEFLDILEKDGLEICQIGKNAFLSFEGSIYEYFFKHERGQGAINHCAKSQWFRNNATQEFLDLVTLLNLDFNKLTSLPIEIGNCQKLKYLYLQGNNFSEQEKAKIKALLPKCTVYF